MEKMKLQNKTASYKKRERDRDVLRFRLLETAETAFPSQLLRKQYSSFRDKIIMCDTCLLTQHNNHLKQY